MPVKPTHPGVYIEEIPSGVRTITGVATSIAAFGGWTAKGPTDRAQLVLSWADFERHFGGLDARSLLGYSVYHFFANGGTQAYIVRLVADDATAATISIDGKLVFNAKNPGQWAHAYGIKTKISPFDANRFKLEVVDGKGITVETFENLSMLTTDKRFVQTVINNESMLIQVETVTGTAPPTNTPPDPTPPPLFAGGNDGTTLNPNDPAFETKLIPASSSGGIFHLDRVDLFNLLCIPGESKPEIISALEGFCRDRRAFLIADSDPSATFNTIQNGPNGALTGDDAINAAFYFPWITAPNPLKENRPDSFPPSGFVAGLYARTDTNRGVWKAPAGTEASLRGVTGVKETLTDNENGILNPQAINCIRTFPVYGTILWGARTLHGNDERGSEWKYIPVRRTALYIEETLYRALKWVVFEPNDEPLWAQIRLNVGAFMHNLFRQGAFQGATPHDAYFVKCDKETTTQNDINLGIVNIVVGFAPLKPAEFVIVKLQQMAGQIEA
ncbi:MAG: phage tail sheath subtilisin-like domain-containing protein [Anaerolineales bacterium]